MQTTKISILAAIAALIITSCEQQVQMVTEINRDGTCTRQISTKEEEWCSLPDDQWEKFTPQDTSDHKTLYFRRAFSCVEEMAANPVLNAYGREIKSNASLTKRFKWFYTDFCFTETFLSWEENTEIPIADYLSKDEASFMWTGYPNLTDGMTGIEMVDYLDKLQEKLDHWEYTVLLNCDMKLIANHYQDIANPPVSRSEFLSLRDTLVHFGRENWYDEFEGEQDLFRDYFKSDAYDIFYKSTTEYSQKYKAEGDSLLRSTVAIVFIKAPYNLKMPGHVTDAGRGTVTDGVINYRFEGGFLLSGDYTITATSRTINIWAFILSFIIILIACLSLLYRKK